MPHRIHITVHKQFHPSVWTLKFWKYTQIDLFLKTGLYSTALVAFSQWQGNLNFQPGTQGSQFAIFQGVPSPPSWRFRGYFLPPLHQLRGYHSVLKAASPSQAMSEDSKCYFECSIWILTAKCNAHGFSQYYNFQNQKITMLENIGYLSELTAWHCYQSHMSGACVWQGENRSHFFRLTHSAKF